MSTLLPESVDSALKVTDDSVDLLVDGRNDDSKEPKLSKKTLRRIRRKESWLANKADRRAKEREKLKLKREKARLSNMDLGPSRKKLKESTMAHSSCKVRVAIDMGFDDLMSPKDLSKCVKQLMRCYTLNRRAENPMQLYFTSFSGKAEQEMSKNTGYKNWDVHIKENSFIDIFHQDDIVYLTSESDNVLTGLDENKVYIIGGLVDHNAHKGLCFRLAEDKKLTHAQLPISDFLNMLSRKVLSIDHVFEIILGICGGLSWRDAFLNVIPQRKGAVTKFKEDLHNTETDSCLDSKSVKSEIDGSISGTETTAASVIGHETL